jgi:hypothetical protein
MHAHRLRLRFFVTGGDDRLIAGTSGEAETESAPEVECAIPALPAHGCGVLRQRAGKGNLLGPSIRKSAQASVIVVLISRSADANWKGKTALQETAHSAKTIMLDDFDQRTSIWCRMAEHGYVEHGPLSLKLL